jgi:hypothetical protein
LPEPANRTPFIGPPAVRAWADWPVSWSANSTGVSMLSGVKAVAVVLDPPVGDEDQCFKQGVELFDGEQLVAHTAAVGLDPGVLPGSAGLDVAGARAAVAHQSHRTLAVSLGTVVCAM